MCHASFSLAGWKHSLKMQNHIWLIHYLTFKDQADNCNQHSFKHRDLEKMEASMEDNFKMVFKKYGGLV